MNRCAGTHVKIDLITPLWSHREEVPRAAEYVRSRVARATRSAATAYRCEVFVLHVSKKERERRFLARADEPKNWKFSVSDIPRSSRRWSSGCEKRLRPGTA